LKKFASMSLDEFLSDKRNPSSAESYLRRSLEAIFDIGCHILARTYGLKELEYIDISQTTGRKGYNRKGIFKNTRENGWI